MKSTLTKEDIEKINKNLLSKLKADLGNKYYCLIKDRDFDMKSFELAIKKEIISFSFNNNPFYKKLFAIVERHFLKLISNCPERQYHGILTQTNIDSFQSLNNFKYDKGLASFPPKVTIRSVIESDKKTKVNLNNK